MPSKSHFYCKNTRANIVGQGLFEKRTQTLIVWPHDYRTCWQYVKLDEKKQRLASVKQINVSHVISLKRRTCVSFLEYSSQFIIIIYLTIFTRSKCLIITTVTFYANKYWRAIILSFSSSYYYYTFIV